MTRQSDSISELGKALAKAQGAMRPAVKDSENPYFKSKYADLASVWEAIRSPLSSNGLAVIQTLDYPSGVPGVIINTMLTHESGEWVEGSLIIKPVKDDPQGIGAAITYGRRFGLAAITGICSDDEDDDGNTASGHAIKSATADQVRSLPPSAPISAPGVALAAKIVSGPVIESIPEICASCGKPITEGTDANGKHFTASKMTAVSRKAYKKPMCYSCFIELKNMAKE